jgi:outer membrane protein OmpA-like peptidoglycan-associated protein
MNTFSVLIKKKLMRLFYVITVMFFLTSTNWALAQSVTNDNNQVKSNLAASHIYEANIIEYNPSTDNHKFMTGVNIEIFNNTTNTEELVLKNHNQHRFSFNFKRGNSYTVMLRKEGYLIKRVNIKLGVEDCISCFEGLNILTPSQQDFASGSLNLQMRKINDGDRVIIPEIQFQGKSTTLTTESQRALVDLAMILKDNSNIISEIEVHTDSKGSAETNKQLSEDRAEVIAKFLIGQNVSENDLFVKGYGESRIINECTDGVDCPEDKHTLNNRVVFKLHTSIGENKIFNRSLSSIVLTESKTPLANNSNTARNGQDVDKKLDVFEVPVQNNNKTIKEDEKTIQVVEKTTAEDNVYPKVVDKEAKKPKIADTTVKDEVFSAPSEKNGIQKVSNSINNVTINANDVTKICVYNKYIPFQTIEEEEGPGINQIREPIGSVNLNTQGEISKEGTIVYGTDGNRVMNRSGRAILVDPTYSGFKVELFTSEAELPNSNIIFEKYGKVYLDDNGVSFSYMIGHFVQKKSADDFLTNVVLPKYPNAQVIKYKDGKRKEKE